LAHQKKRFGSGGRLVLSDFYIEFECLFSIQFDPMFSPWFFRLPVIWEWIVC